MARPQGVRRESGGYDAFLSYAWDPRDTEATEVSDAAVARRLRYAMQDLGKPRTRRSDLAIFLDRSVQTPSPDLWRGILANLDRSRFLVVLCSPRAAASDGVSREVWHWLHSGRRLDDMLVVLLNGAADEALPAPLQRLHANGRYDPLFVDLRWVRSARDLDSRTSSRFREDVATLLAPIRGVAKETLVDEELTVRERGIRVQRRFIVGLSVTVVLALVLGLAATVQWGRADEQARIAESRALAAGAQNQISTRLGLAQLLAVEGFRRHDNLETRATLLRAGVASPSLVRYLDAGAQVSTLTTATDGNTVVAGTDSGRLRRWSLPDAEQVRDLAGLTGKVTAVATDAAGGTVAATDGRAVFVWRADQPGAPVALAPSDEVRALGLSPGGRWLVMALADPAVFDKSVLAIVDVHGAEPARRFPVGLNVSTIVLPGEDEIVAVSGDGPWQRLRPSTGATLGRSLTSVTGLHKYADAVSPDGAFFVWTNGSVEIPVWRTDHPADADKPDLVAESPGRFPEALAVASGGRFVAVADSGTITVSGTRAPTGQSPWSATLTGDTAALNLHFVDRDRRLVSAGGSAVALWDLDQLARSARWTPIALPSGCTGCAAPTVAISPDGAFAAVDTDLEGLVIARLPTGAGAPQPQETLFGDVEAVRWSDAATLEVKVGESGPVELREGGADGPVVATGAVPADGTASLRGRMPITITLRAAGDAEAVARTRADGLLEATWARIPQKYSPDPVTLAPDRTEAATVVGGDVWLVDLGRGVVSSVPVGDALGVRLTADRLLVSRGSGAFEIRDRATRAVVASVAGGAPSRDGLAISSDGSLAARLRRDGTVEVVDVARAGVLGVLGAPTTIIDGQQPGLGFSADGVALAVAYSDRDGRAATLDLYDLAPDRLVQVACATAGRDLTAAEWRQFVNDAVPDDLRCTR